MKAKGFKVGPPPTASSSLTIFDEIRNGLASAPARRLFMSTIKT
jgi:hypothetical protein